MRDGAGSLRRLDDCWQHARLALHRRGGRNASAPTQALRGNFENDALIVAAAYHRGAKDISGVIDCYAAVGEAAFAAAGEVVEVGQRPSAVARG